MNAGTSINTPNLAPALALSWLLVAFAPSAADDKPAPAILRRSPDSAGVTGKGATAKAARPVRIKDSTPVEDSNSADIPPPAAVDRQVVPASDNTGVNRVRIRAVERPADGIPGVPRRTTPAASSTRPANTSNPATARITSEDPTPAHTTPPNFASPNSSATQPAATQPTATQQLSTTQSSTSQASTAQVTNRLPPLGRAIGTPPASAPLRTSPANNTAPSMVRNPNSAPAQTTIASDQDSTPSSSATVNAGVSTGSRKSPSRATAKTTAPKESSNALTRGMAYFDPTKLMPWMRPNNADSKSAPAAEAESVVIDDGSASTAMLASPKPKVAQKAKKRSSKAKSADVAASQESNTASSSSFFNPLKSVRQIWSGTEPATPKINHTAKAKQPVAELPPEASGEDLAAPEQKPSMLAQLFGRNRDSEKAPLVKKPKRVPAPQDSDVEIDSSAAEETADEVAIARAPAGGHSLSDNEVTEVAETFQKPPPPVLQAPPRAANAKLGAPIIELADEEIATAGSDKVIR